MATNSTATTKTTDQRPAFHALAGDCLVETRGPTNRTHRGQVFVLVKPDDTVLVHDLAGYKPVAWITRAETISVADGGDALTAVDGDHWLRIEVRHTHLDRRVPSSRAGPPAGTCSRCDGTLVAAAGDVHCVGCRDRYGLPEGAELLETVCECGLPHMRFERGDVFELCIDRECEPMETAIADRFDGEWDCREPDCDGNLRVIRRGGLLAGCDRYPECDAAFKLPVGILDGHCGCGLPRFATDDALQCLDLTCEATG